MMIGIRKNLAWWSKSRSFLGVKDTFEGKMWNLSWIVSEKYHELVCLHFFHGKVRFEKF